MSPDFDDTADPDRPDVEAVKWEAWEHLTDRRWEPGSGMHQNLSGFLESVLKVWGAHSQVRDHPGGPGMSVADDRDTLAALTVLHHQVREGVDQLEAELIGQARRRGLTWEQIAAACGKTGRQPMWLYHRRLAARAPDNIL